MKKVMIMLSEELLPAIDTAASEDGISRSEWLRRIAADRLAEREQAALEALMEEGYREMAGENLADARALGALAAPEED